MKNTKFKMTTLATLGFAVGLSLTLETGRAATADTGANPPSHALAACSSIDLRTVPPGTRCASSQGLTFERVARDGVGEAWSDPDGAIWTDVVANKEVEYQALETCRNLGGRLPSKSDFKWAEHYRFREVLPHMDGYVFWTSTGDDGNEYAFTFDGSDGDFDFNYVGSAFRPISFWHPHDHTPMSVRCVF